jgi:hypothetical protein
VLALLAICAVGEVHTGISLVFARLPAPRQSVDSMGLLNFASFAAASQQPRPTSFES